MLRAVVVGVILALGIAGGGVANPFDEGCEAFDRGDFEAALDAWKPLAEDGHPGAQFRLGCLYTFGQGVEVDHARALDLYLEAARQGDPDAQNNLGSLYALGWGTEPDPIEAYKWLEIAARAGHEMATANRNFLADKLTASDVAEAKARADDFLAARAVN